jgi:uncharacterized cupin superfamily protein
VPGSISADDAGATNERAATATRGDTYYDQRLRSWKRELGDRAEARTSIHEDELEWVTTPQDARVALLVSPDTGFDTWGVETSVAEIPVGWHTGRHRHGEEAIYVISGSGFVVVDDRRYDFFPGTTIGIPYGAAHQLYNTGTDAVRYLSATPFPLERFVRLHRLEQLEETGPTDSIPSLPSSSTGYDTNDRRIRLLWEDARYRDGRVTLLSSLHAKLRAGVDLSRSNEDGAPKATGGNAKVATGIGHHSARVHLMDRYGRTDFPNRLVFISGFLIEEPGARSGRHAHMDAIIYVVQGRGHSVVDGQHIPWKAGTTLHVRGPQIQHQHFNTGSERSFLLRIASGLRPDLETATADVFPYLWFEAQGAIDGEAPASR